MQHVRNFLKNIVLVFLLIFSFSRKITFFILWPITKRIFGTKFKHKVNIGKRLYMNVYGDMADMVNKVLFYYSSIRKYAWEPLTTRLFLRLLKDKKCIVTAGAHLGYYALIAGKKLPRAEVYGFEPVPTIFRRFSDNVSLNKLSNVYPNNIALSDSVGEVSILDDNAQSSIDISSSEDKGCSKVKTDSLDNFFSLKPNKPDLILLDVEGYEMSVLKGASSLLENKPDIIIEINDKMLRKFNTNSNDVYNKLKGFGYDLYYIDDEYDAPQPFRSKTVKLYNLDKKPDHHSSFFNILATGNIKLLVNENAQNLESSNYLEIKPIK